MFENENLLTILHALMKAIYIEELSYKLFVFSDEDWSEVGSKEGDREFG